jgi:putative FmdB family regulatory protein
MPTYMYKCADCGHRFEDQQGFHDDPHDTCPDCGGQVRRVIGNVGVTFKGSGFYRTDSRSDKKKTSAPAKTETKSESSAPAKTETSTPAAKDSGGSSKGSSSAS